VHRNIRPVISFGIACVGGLATALLALPAAAGMNSWTAIGPDGTPAIGTYPLAVDPSSPSTIYSVVNGTYGTTVVKTTDGGVNWAELANSPALVYFEFLVIDPTSPATIYVGGGIQPFDGEDAIYKSVDGGAHWAPAVNGLGTSEIRLLAIAPSQSSTLYAAGEANVGVVKSIDGGLSWAMINSGLTGLDVSALAVDPTNADAAYVAQRASTPFGSPATATIFKSTDGPDQWRQVPIAVPVGAAITSFAIDPATPSIVYAAYDSYNLDYSDKGGVFKSVDGGETWVAAQNGLSDAGVLALAIDPSAPTRIYAAAENGVFMSTDAAASWTPINAGLPSPFVTWGISIDRIGSLLRIPSYAGLFEYQVSGSSSATSVPLIEYFHAEFGHYFITSIPDEISKLDNGTVAGWARTGLQFNAYAAPNENSVPVCRFFSATFAPKSSHFYTPFATECATRQADPAWTLESSDAFDIAVPAADGSCAAGLTPVYRLYNNGQGGAPNHRYTTDLTVRAQMIAQAWVPEGLGPNAVEMCSPQ
jgi:photosystem II stability/assembly factor-like uncharacterized protein